MPQNAPDNIFERHNHHRCAKGAMAAARQVCVAQNLRLTPVRARVLEILLESHKALGAYDILDRLRDDGLGDKPPIVYRALDFLVANGLAHRLERLNAFAACSHVAGGHEPIFLICKECRQVAEAPLDVLAAGIAQSAARVGFEVQSRVVEVIGRCSSCQTEARA